jgi:uncharacterized cupin superfamily protein
MQEIKVNHNPDEATLDAWGIKEWPIWEKETSEFPWTYDSAETCYILEGHVIVTPDGGEPVEIKKGDLVVFPAGMSCTWKILEDIRKHYNFG